ncbi:MAG: hypothetical protein HY544_00775 [Candidatus Diapherotrites archaeon]|uniref:Uncharacterized protein n=1 Tax=Candidatus Iainarchaeum sp. TaxID=3101447 RepID=A0A8T3YL42_9ARCH|nr:hypothetical protein [Candidatus Diapherotrites archaeon]
MIAPARQQPVSGAGSGVFSFVEQCASSSAEKAAARAAPVGGYMTPPPESIRLRQGGVDRDIAYYYFGGSDLTLGREELQTELSAIVNEELAFCLDDFSAFQGVKVEHGQPSVTAVVSDQAIVVGLDFPVTVRVAGSAESRRAFNAEAKSSLGRLHSEASSLSRAIAGSAGGFPAGYAFDSRLDYHVINLDSRRTVYGLDDKSGLVFMFATLK